MRGVCGMKCLVIDEVHSNLIEGLKKHMKVDINTFLTKEELIEIIPEYNVLIMRISPQIDKDVLTAANNLKVIGICSIGVNHVDMEAAEQLGITVYNSPGLNSQSVAELVIAGMLNLSRGIVRADKTVKNQRSWSKYMFNGREISGKTLGIIGFGKIGQLVAGYAKAFDIKVLTYDIIKNEEALIKYDASFVSLERIYRESDYITMHLPLTEETKNMISADEIAMMKNDCMLINMSRGGIVDENAVKEALENGRLGGFATDVLCFETIDETKVESPLFDLDDKYNFIVTPHIGAQTDDSLERIGISMLEKIKEYFGLEN
jgi:D-3-phosphoglycerate dehydrogenase